MNKAGSTPAHPLGPSRSRLTVNIQVLLHHSTWYLMENDGTNAKMFIEVLSEDLSRLGLLRLNFVCGVVPYSAQVYTLSGRVIGNKEDRTQQAPTMCKGRHQGTCSYSWWRRDMALEKWKGKGMPQAAEPGARWKGRRRGCAPPDTGGQILGWGWCSEAERSLSLLTLATQLL